MSERIFECQMCGNCCQGQGGIVISEPEQKRIADFLSLSLEEFLDSYTEFRNGKRCIKTRENDCCIFFHQREGCGIHPVKPDVCRAWPFFRGNLLDEMSFELAKDYCPGIKPDADHEDFVHEGIAYLEKHALSGVRATGAANALLIEDIDQWK
jgi:hypothetical protein